MLRLLPLTALLVIAAGLLFTNELSYQADRLLAAAFEAHGINGQLVQARARHARLVRARAQQAPQTQQVPFTRDTVAVGRLIRPDLARQLRFGTVSGIVKRDGSLWVDQASANGYRYRVAVSEPLQSSHEFVLFRRSPNLRLEEPASSAMDTLMNWLERRAREMR